MTLLWILTIMSALAVVVHAVCVTLFLRRCAVLRPARVPVGHVPLISIIVPARNEAVSIERCVRSLLAQNYPRIEVLAVDDSSVDDTLSILARLAAADPRLRVVAGAPLPRGWTGKSYAVFQGVQQARGQWLLFVDADVVLHAGTLSAAYRVASEQRVAMLSLWARQELVSFWERVVQPVVIGFNIAADPLLRVNSPRHREAAFANGQFLLVERGAYRRIGGHTRVRDDVLEDQRLAWHFKHAGQPIMMMDGSHVLRTRMYTSLRSLWEGWSKNNFLTLQRNWVLMIVVATGVYLVAVNPFVMLLWTLLALKFNYLLADPLLINLLLIALVFWTRWRTRSFCGTPLRDYLWHALGGLVFVGIFFNSAYRHTWGRGVTWKGRRYQGDSVA